METVKFYSEHDMAGGIDLNKIVDKINKNEMGEISTITDLIEFHNILKYIEIERFSKYIEINANIDCKIIEKELHKKIGQFLSNVNCNRKSSTF